jgi:hypothetical protein
MQRGDVRGAPDELTRTLHLAELQPKPLHDCDFELIGESAWQCSPEIPLDRGQLVEVRLSHVARKRIVEGRWKPEPGGKFGEDRVCDHLAVGDHAVKVEDQSANRHPKPPGSTPIAESQSDAKADQHSAWTPVPDVRPNGPRVIPPATLPPHAARAVRGDRCATVRDTAPTALLVGTAIILMPLDDRFGGKTGSMRYRNGASAERRKRAPDLNRAGSASDNLFDGNGIGKPRRVE